MNKVKDKPWMIRTYAGHSSAEASNKLYRTNLKKGQTVMIVEAMKTMNHVPSTSDGEVKKILVDDGQPVEFGQTLVLLK